MDQGSARRAGCCLIAISDSPSLPAIHSDFSSLKTASPGGGISRVGRCVTQHLYAPRVPQKLVQRAIDVRRRYQPTELIWIKLRSAVVRASCSLWVMCGRLRVGKKNLHAAALVGAAMCSAFECGTHDRWP